MANIIIDLKYKVIYLQSQVDIMEHWHESCSSSSSTSYIEVDKFSCSDTDLNGDGRVDGDDYSIFIDCYNGNCNYEDIGMDFTRKADFNKDGSIDKTDNDLIAGCYED